MFRRLAFFPTVAAVLAAAPSLPMAIGLDTQASEWVVSLDGGGELRDRGGRTILHLRPGEKLRIWLDQRGEADPTGEYRIQVGPAMALQPAERLMARLRALGEAPERKLIPDGDSWRVLTGHFDAVEEAEPILVKLQAQGLDELWVSSEPRPGKAPAARARRPALYAVTERYDRRPLPWAGVSLRPAGEWVQLVGKGRYRGAVEVLPNAQNRLTVVNRLDLETYLRGVVPREMGAGEFPSIEALKAQAVAARTYAVANRGKRAADGFDLLDTPADQAYGGRDGEQPLTDRAVAETEGLFAVYGDRPILSLFTADCGGHTVDVGPVFGGEQPYLKGVPCYPAKPQTLPFKAGLTSAWPADQSWLGPELVRLASEAMVPLEWLDPAKLQQPARYEDLLRPVAAVQRRLGLSSATERPRDGRGLLVWIGRSLGMGGLVEGLERPQDADYFLAGSAAAPADRLLAAFMTRRGLVPASLWGQEQPTLLQALQVLGRAWQELEPAEWSEGTLLRDGQVRRKNGGPEAFAMDPRVLLLEEAPGGALHLVDRSDVQVGDKLRWIPGPSGAKVVLRRLDPDGAAWDRYNPTAHWRVELREADLLDRLRQRVNLRDLKELRATHNAEGRVLELEVVEVGGRTHRFHGMKIRSLLGLKENPFRFLVIQPQGGARRWIFYGRGWGHGVGMCQTGAYGMALEGYTFDQILQHYYPGSSLKRVQP